MPVRIDIDIDFDIDFLQLKIAHPSIIKWGYAE